MKRLLILLVDLAIGLPLLAVMVLMIAGHFLFFHLPWKLGPRRRPRPTRLINLIPASLKQNIAKGELWQLETWDMNGYFDPLVQLHYPSPEPLDTMLNERNRYMQIPLKFRAAFEAGFKFSVMIANNIFFLHTIARLIRRIRPAAMVANTPFFEGVNAWLLYLMTGCPNLLAVHCNFDIEFSTTGLPKHLPNKTLARLVERFNYHVAQELYPIRESQKRYMLQYYPRPERMKIRHHGIPLDFLDHPPDPAVFDRYGVPRRDLIVFAGRLSPYNYVNDIVEFASLVLPKHPEAFFLLLGEEGAGSGVRSQLEGLIRERGLTDHFGLPGFVPNKEMLSFRRLARVNLITMGGFSLIEAAASGVPCVCYDIDWHWELIENNKSGLLVPFKDYQAFADAILMLLKNEEIGPRFASAALEKVRVQHTLEAAFARKAELYEDFFSRYYRDSAEDRR